MTRRGFLAASAAVLSSDLHWLDIHEAAALIRRRRLSPVELVKASLARIERLNPSLNAVITPMNESALARARELEAEQMRGKVRGPLHGIPIGLKDLYDTAGVRTTAASAHFATRVPDKDATVVARLREAGAVAIGKLNMDEFAFNFTSETSHFGPTHNPWKRGYMPGGSSGASAVALAAGLCMGALGSDTGGSIRLPAAVCGITGFKPSYGKLPADGVLPLAWSLDHVGPMARTAADAHAMMAAMGAPVAVDKRPLKSVRIGIPRARYWEKIAPETGKLVSAAVELLGKIAGGAREVQIPMLEGNAELAMLPKVYGSIIMPEAFAYHEQRIRTEPEKFHAVTIGLLKAGQATPVGEYARALQDMAALRTSSRELFRDADLLVMPAAPGPAFPLGSQADLIYLRNLAPWNLLGLPAISVPCGLTGEGLPVGMQIVGPANGDALVLAAAEAYQRETDWHRRHPSLG
ncbi:MAG: amidase [Bryobacteraceae bacterium]